MNNPEILEVVPEAVPPRHLSAADALSHPSLLVMQADCVAFAAVEQAGVTLLVASPIAPGATEITVTLHGSPITLRTAPMLCLGFFASTPMALAQLSPVQALFELWSGMAFPAPVLLAQADALSTLLASSLTERSRTAAAYAARLATELAHLRSATSDLRANFAKVDALVTQAGLSVPRLEFENPPASSNTGTGRHQLRQILPVSSLGLAAVDLHVARTYKGAATITIQLTTLEDHECHADWTLTAAQCQDGWISLPLPVVPGGLARTPELVISTADGTSALPEFSLGLPQPLPRFRAQAGEVRLAGSLALRCWAGLSGTKLADLTAGEPTGLVTEVRFPAMLRATVKRHCRAWETEWVIVQDMPDKSGVFCHPPPPDVTPGLTAAVIDGVNVDRPMLISARAVVKNALAAPVEFALAAAPAGVEVIAELFDAVACETDDLCFSGWLRASHGEDAFVSLSLPPSAAPQQLFFVTRMADGVHNDHAQASFEELRITFFGTPEQGQFRRASVSASDLARVRSPFDRFDETVSYRVKEHAVLCHPASSGIKMGGIPDLVPHDAAGVCTNVRLGHKDAAPVEFAMAISALPGAQVLATLTAGTEGGAAIAASGWLKLRAGERGRLEVNTTALQPASGPLTLYFLTRMAREAETAEHAWAYFQDTEILLPDNGEA